MLTAAPPRGPDEPRGPLCAALTLGRPRRTAPVELRRCGYTAPFLHDDGRHRVCFVHRKAETLTDEA